MTNEELIKHLHKRIEQLEQQRKELIEYVNGIDDRNSLKMQMFKSNVEKILKKERK